LVRLWEARPNIASRGLSREWYVPLAILLHLSDLVFNNNGLVDHVLKVGVVDVQQLELNVIIQPVQEHVLLLLIHVDVVRGIPWQLDEWVKVLIHYHAALFQVGEFLPLKLHCATGHVVGVETSLELVPGDGVDVCMGIAICLPPVSCYPIKLMRSKKDLLTICALGDHEFLLDPLEPIFCVHGVFGLWEGGGASSQELRQMGLVWWWRWGYLLLVGLHAVEGLQHGFYQLSLGGE
jgi:hypothetical protein